MPISLLRALHGSHTIKIKHNGMVQMTCRMSEWCEQVSILEWCQLGKVL